MRIKKFIFKSIDDNIVLTSKKLIYKYFKGIIKDN